MLWAALLCHAQMLHPQWEEVFPTEVSWRISLSFLANKLMFSQKYGIAEKLMGSKQALLLLLQMYKLAE